MESRASTRLAENVKLLTYISIFYLPLSFCVALWSINENYARASLIKTSVVVGGVTYLVVANLNIIIHQFSQGYRPFKNIIVKAMQNTGRKWLVRGNGFKAFPPPQESAKTSEWWILYFFISRLLLGLKSHIVTSCDKGKKTIIARSRWAWNFVSQRKKSDRRRASADASEA